LCVVAWALLALAACTTAAKIKYTYLFSNIARLY
jgi:hypothetical protein